MRSRDNPTCIRTRALHIHEVGVGRLHKPLELVAALLVLGRGVEEVDGERLIVNGLVDEQFCFFFRAHDADRCPRLTILTATKSA